MKTKSELERLEEFARLAEEDAKTPGIHALKLNALGEEIALLRKRSNG